VTPFHLTNGLGGKCMSETIRASGRARVQEPGSLSISTQQDMISRAEQSERTASAIHTAQMAQAMIIAETGAAAQAAQTVKSLEIARLTQAVQGLQATQSAQTDEYIASLGRKMAYAEIRIIKLECELETLRQTVDELVGKRTSSSSSSPSVAAESVEKRQAKRPKSSSSSSTSWCMKK
jgi:hypothetical protein